MLNLFPKLLRLGFFVAENACVFGLQHLHLKGVLGWTFERMNGPHEGKFYLFFW